MKRFAPYPGSGTAGSKNVIIQGNARFTVLSPSLIRMEYAEEKNFEDRSSYFAVRRDMIQQEYSYRRDDGTLYIETGRLRLKFKYDAGAFSASNLGIAVIFSEGDEPVLWKPGMVEQGNLGGTLRTLDGVGGAKDVGVGFLSRDGWHLVDDSDTVLFTDEETPWVTPRPKNGNLDWYFFGYGLDYRSALRDMTTLGGKIPLPPRYALGSWYSRYWPYTSKDFIAVAEEYQQHGFPLDVMVIDMDWHEDGWTGYTWNQKLIPDPKALLLELHKRGLKVTLNLHPHDGVGSHEKAYAEFVRATGLGIVGKQAVAFDITERKFAHAYFSVLLRPLENDGVDFWWMDWQQGNETKIEGLDPLMWLNYLHFRDRQGDRNKMGPPLRGMNFSRWAGLGDHRHPVHFSGDTHSNWEVLEFLTPFTTTAGNVGAAYWSHDIGGNLTTAGRTDPELFTRWIQFGAFSPVLRVHSARDKDNDRRPWLYGQPWTEAIRKAYDMREQLTPYRYTAARLCYDSGVAPVRPMYLQYPRESQAYEVPGQFMLGEDLLVAPASRPGFGKHCVVHVPIWFPAGDWYHITSHRRFQGPLNTVVAVPLDGMAVFARGGAAIPMKGDRIRLYPGSSAARELYEDDGESVLYCEGEFRRTAMLSRRAKSDGPMEFLLGPCSGNYTSAPKTRPAMTLEVPKGRVELMSLPEGALTSVTQVLLHSRWSPEAADIGEAMMELAERLELSRAELEADDCLVFRMDEIKQIIGQVLGCLDSAEEETAVQELRQRLEKAKTQLLGELAQRREPEVQAALRIVFGMSMSVMVKTLHDSSKMGIEIELLREHAQAGLAYVQVQVRNVFGPVNVGMKLNLKAESRQVFTVDCPFDYGKIGPVEGTVLLEANGAGQRIQLREDFQWKATAVRDWLVLSPVETDSGPTMKGFGRTVDLKAPYPKLGGGTAKWQHCSISPSGVMRNIRETYDFGDLFYCPKGEAWAATVLYSEAEARAVLELVPEANATVWVNGVEIQRDLGSFRPHHLEVLLSQGENLLAVKMVDLNHKGGFVLRVNSCDSALRFRHPQPETLNSISAV